MIFPPVFFGRPEGIFPSKEDFMKTIVKVLCVLMCLLMALSVLSACNKKGGPNNPSDNTDTPIDNPVDPNGNEDPNSGEDPNQPTDPVDNPTDPVDDPNGREDLIDDIMRAKYPDKEVIGIAYPEDLLALMDIVNSSANVRALTKDTVYYLASDIDMNPYWVAETIVDEGELYVPFAPSETCEGFLEFYGIFDGNGHTISGLYILNNDVISYDSIGFFGDLHGSVKDLTLENCFICGKADSGDIFSEVSIGALAGRLIGDELTIENISVKSAYIVFESDTCPYMGGVIGMVDGEDNTLRSVSFEGQVILAGADTRYPSPAEEVLMAQIVGYADDNDLLLEDCLAGGLLFGVEPEEEAKNFCADGDTFLELVDCRVESPIIEEDPEGIISIRTKRDLMALDPSQTYEGVTIRLLNDIDFNPGWSAESVHGEKFEFPDVFWSGIPAFAGTLDGQGHKISGVCRFVDLDKSEEYLIGGFIGVLLEGASIQNLTIDNSALFVYTTSKENFGSIRLGAVVGRAEDGTSIKDVILDVDLWAIGNVTGYYGGIQAYDNAYTTLTIENSYFIGETGKLDIEILSELLKSFDPYTPEGYDDEIIEVSNATELMAVMTRAQKGENFAGKTVRLTANIDLNPGVKVSATIDSATGDLVFPNKDLIVNEWLGIPVFKGMFDGNGYAISGLYSWRNAISINTGNYGGLIDSAEDCAIIKNLVIRNSLHVVNNTGDSAWGSRNIHTGGLVGRTDKGLDVENTFALTVSNVYVDMDVVIICSNHSTIGGLLGFCQRYEKKTNSAGKEVTFTSPYRFENVVFAGRVINTNFTLKVPFTSPKDEFSVSQIVSDTNWGSQHKLTNVLAAGEIICGNTSGVNAIFGATTYSGVACSNVVTGRYTSTPKACFNASSGQYNSSFSGNTSWVYDHDLGFYLPQKLSKMIADSGLGETLWNDLDSRGMLDQDASNPNEIHVSTAEELIALATSGKDFKGQTIYLDSDIDFNPGWSAATSIVDGKVVFPSEPAVTWTAFANFKGRFNGRGHTISGLYSKRTVASSNKGDYGLLIDTQSDGSVRNLAIVNSILIVENPNASNPAVHDLCIGGLAGNIHKTQVKSADKDKDKYALGNSEHYGFTVGNFFTDMEVWLVSKSNALVGGLIGYVNANYTIQHIAFAGKVGNTNALDGTGSASFSATNGSNLAMGRIVGCNNWYSAAYLEDAVVVGQLITGTSSSYIHYYVGADDKVGYGRCNTTLSATRPDNVDADDDWVLSDTGYYVHKGIVAFANRYAPSLSINNGTVNGLTLLPKNQASGVTMSATQLSVTIPEGATAIANSAFEPYAGTLTSITLPSTIKTIGASAFKGCTLLGEVKLPDTLETIGMSVFEGISSLTLTTGLPSALINIGASAFKGCTSIGTVTLSDSLSSIGASAFEGCTGLKLTAIPPKVQMIGASAFKGCTGLTNLTLDNDGTVNLSIGDSAFEGCTNLSLTTIPAKVNYIGTDAFKGCPNLTDLTFGYDGTLSLTIKSGAFDNIVTLRGTPEFLFRVRDDDAIKKNVTTIYVTSGDTLDINYIQDYKLLTSILLPDTLTTIKRWAFKACPALATITIPATVTTVEEGAFYNMTAMTSYAVEAGNTAVKAVDGNLYTADGATLLAYAAGKTDEAFAIPTTVTKIGAYAFNACKKATTFTYAGTIEEFDANVTVDENAFDAPTIVTCSNGNTCGIHTVEIDVEAVAPDCTTAGCTKGSHCSLCGKILETSAEVPALGHEYGDDDKCIRCGALKPSAGLAFVSNGDDTCYVSGIGGYESLDVEIPETSPEGDTVTGIGNFAFAGTAITSVSIPATVESIGVGAFANCSSLVIDFDTVAAGNAGGYTSTEDGIYANGGKTLVRYTSSQYKTSYTAPKSVTEIEDYAFSGCIYVTAIGAASGRNANPNYKGSSYLYSKDGKTFVAFPAGRDNTSYTIDANTVSIANGAFWGCTNLTSVTLASTVKTIGDRAFYGCTNLATINLNGATLTSIGTDAFKGTALETIPTVAN